MRNVFLTDMQKSYINVNVAVTYIKSSASVLVVWRLYHYENTPIQIY